MNRPMAPMKNLVNQASYLNCVEDLLSTSQVESMKQWKHHLSVTTYDHSLFVSYVAFRMARRLKCDYRMAARMGLLHDLYLYDSHDPSDFSGSHCFGHPVAAVNNARELIELSEKEENIIVSHMWPLAKYAPRSREAVIVNLADKLCATMEASYLPHVKRIRRWFPDTAGISVEPVIPRTVTA